MQCNQIDLYSINVDTYQLSYTRQSKYNIMIKLEFDFQNCKAEWHFKGYY